MKRVYLDNAATTPMLPEVVEAMVQTMNVTFGNPSSTHAFGRSAKAVVENARKNIAKHLQCTTSEIVFTSGGTEADNFILKNAVHHLGVQHIVTSTLEHHAVLHTVDFLATKGIQISYVNTLENGTIDYTHLEEILANSPQKTLISLMHVNNEIGTILDLSKVIALKKQYHALFHSDTVQSIGHFEIDLSALEIDFITAAAHKFHGPKGVGLLYIAKGHKICPLLHGGGQERNMRGGTENLYGIVGFAKALELSYTHLKEHTRHIHSLKQRMIAGLREHIPGVQFNGLSDDLERSLYTVLNVSLPPSEDNSMLLFNLDLHQISASGGSACSSGAQLGSHVLRALNGDPQRGAIRFSFSRNNTSEEVDYVVKTLASLYSVAATR